MSDPYGWQRRGAGRAAARMLRRARNVHPDLRNAALISDKMRLSSDKRKDARRIFSELKEALKAGEARAMARMVDER